MTLLGIALFQPHGDAVSWAGYVQNLVPVTLGNIIGGALLVAGLYWFAAPLQAAAAAIAPKTNPAPEPARPVLVPESEPAAS
jgi:hypothetical protein